MIIGSHWVLVVDFAAFGFRPRKVKSEKMKGPPCGGGGVGGHKEPPPTPGSSRYIAPDRCRKLESTSAFEGISLVPDFKRRAV